MTEVSRSSFPNGRLSQGENSRRGSRKKSPASSSQQLPSSVNRKSRFSQRLSLSRQTSFGPATTSASLSTKVAQDNTSRTSTDQNVTPSLTSTEALNILLGLSPRDGAIGRRYRASDPCMPLVSLVRTQAGPVPTCIESPWDKARERAKNMKFFENRVYPPWYGRYSHLLPIDELWKIQPFDEIDQREHDLAVAKYMGFDHPCLSREDYKDSSECDLLRWQMFQRQAREEEFQKKRKKSLENKIKGRTPLRKLVGKSTSSLTWLTKKERGVAQSTISMFIGIKDTNTFIKARKKTVRASQPIFNPKSKWALLRKPAVRLKLVILERKNKARERFSMAIGAVKTALTVCARLLYRVREAHRICQSFADLKGPKVFFDPSKYTSYIQFDPEIIKILSSPWRTRTAYEVEDIIESLEYVKGFVAMPPLFQNYMAKVGGFICVPPNGAIVRQGQKAENFYVILSGSVKLTRFVGNPVIGEPCETRYLKTYRRFEVFGEESLTSNCTRQYSAHAMCQCYLLAVAVHDYQEISVDPDWNDLEPEHITFTRAILDVTGITVDRPRLYHPGNVVFHYFVEGSRIVSSLQKSEWVFIVVTGQVVGLNYVEAPPGEEIFEEWDTFQPQVPIYDPETHELNIKPKKTIIKERRRSRQLKQKFSDTAQISIDFRPKGTQIYQQRKYVVEKTKSMWDSLSEKEKEYVRLLSGLETEQMDAYLDYLINSEPTPRADNKELVERLHLPMIQSRMWSKISEEEKREKWRAIRRASKATEYKNYRSRQASIVEDPGSEGVRRATFGRRKAGSMKGESRGKRESLGGYNSKRDSLSGFTSNVDSVGGAHGKRESISGVDGKRDSISGGNSKRDSISDANNKRESISGLHNIRPSLGGLNSKRNSMGVVNVKRDSVVDVNNKRSSAAGLNNVGDNLGELKSKRDSVHENNRQLAVLEPETSVHKTPSKNASRVRSSKGVRSTPSRHGSKKKVHEQLPEASRTMGSLESLPSLTGSTNSRGFQGKVKTSRENEKRLKQNRNNSAVHYDMCSSGQSKQKSEIRLQTIVNQENAQVASKKDMSIAKPLHSILRSDSSQGQSNFNAGNQIAKWMLNVPPVKKAQKFGTFPRLKSAPSLRSPQQSEKLAPLAIQKRVRDVNASNKTGSLSKGQLPEEPKASARDGNLSPLKEDRFQTNAESKLSMASSLPSGHSIRPSGILSDMQDFNSEDIMSIKESIKHAWSNASVKKATSRKSSNMSDTSTIQKCEPEIRSKRVIKGRYTKGCIMGYDWVDLNDGKYRPPKEDQCLVSEGASVVMLRRAIFYHKPL